MVAGLPHGDEAEVRDDKSRFVKIVRSRIGRFLVDQTVRYELARPEHRIEGLRRKLAEEAIEYLLDPTVGELADVYDVVRALARHDLGITMDDLMNVSLDKSAERGDFTDELFAMYVSCDRGVSPHG